VLTVAHLANGPAPHAEIHPAMSETHGASAQPAGDSLHEVESALQALRVAHSDAERQTALNTLDTATRRLRGHFH
jgi:hypothetical protein